MKKLGVLLFLLSLCGLLAGFSDVEAGSWYARPVDEMAQAGWVSGYSDGTFRPNRTVSAAEFVTLTARCAGIDPVQGQAEHWAAGDLEAALQAGWYDWDELPPTGERFDQPISRKLAV